MANSNRLLAIGSGLLQGINRGRQNMMIIQQKQQELNMKKEKHDIEMKKAKLDLDYDTKQMGDDAPIIQTRKDTLKKFDTKVKADYEWGATTQNKAMRQEQRQVTLMQKEIQNAANEYTKENFKRKYGSVYNPSTNKHEMPPWGEAQFKLDQKEAALRQKQRLEGRDIADPGGLSGEQQLQAHALARKVAGVRGAKNVLPTIQEEMRQGKSIDEIEDTLRYSGQSAEFRGAPRDAVQSIMVGKSDTITQKEMDIVDNLLTEGKEEQAKGQIKRLARKNAGVDEERMLNTKERTVEFLGEIKNDLQQLEEAGINTNIFAGTKEQIAKKIGAVSEPGLRKTATKISTALINYRKGVSGVAFNQIEAQEYKDIFPSIGKTKAFNTATIDALQETFRGDLETYYGLAMGEQNYEALFKQDAEGGDELPDWVDKEEYKRALDAGHSKEEVRQFLGY